MNLGGVRPAAQTGGSIGATNTSAAQVDTSRGRVDRSSVDTSRSDSDTPRTEQRDTRDHRPNGTGLRLTQALPSPGGPATPDPPAAGVGGVQARGGQRDSGPQRLSREDNGLIFDALRTTQQQHIDAPTAESLGRNGLKGLERIDPSISVNSSGDSLTVSRNGREIFRESPPNGADAMGTARWTGTLSRAGDAVLDSFSRVPAANGRAVTTGTVTKSILEGAIGVSATQPPPPWQNLPGWNAG